MGYTITRTPQEKYEVSLAENQEYRIVAVKGDEWNAPAEVFYWPGYEEERFRLRYDVKRGPFEDFAFMYKITGKPRQMYKGGDTVGVRVKLWSPGDGEPDGEPFGGWLILKK